MSCLRHPHAACQTEADSGQQEEEIQALSAIYGDDFLVVNETEKLFDIRIRHEDNSWWSMTLQFLLPRNYPSSVPPVFEVHAGWLNDWDELEIREKLHSIYRDSNGELVVFQWVEQMREFMNEKAVDYGEETCEAVPSHGIPDNFFQDPKNDSTSEFSATESPQLTTVLDDVEQDCTGFAEESDSPDILHGEPMTDRKSTFQAHLVKVSSEQEMENAVRELKRNRKVANASHNIVAYRIKNPDSSVIVQDFDDDGEHNAGSRLLHLLQILNVQNYVIIVSRWYGGVLLGPDRFKHINNCARNLLKTAKVIQDRSTKNSPHNKESKNKRKVKNKF